MDLEGGMLLEMVEYSETYQWKEEGNQGSLVTQVAWSGDTLVIDLTPFEQMQIWPNGQSLVWQMQSLLGRLRGEPQQRTWSVSLLRQQASSA